MAFPNFAGKHAHDAFFNPQDYIVQLYQTVRAMLVELSSHAHFP